MSERYRWLLWIRRGVGLVLLSPLLLAAALIALPVLCMTSALEWLREEFGSNL